jgi:hypothetical protein
MRGNAGDATGEVDRSDTFGLFHFEYDTTGITDARMLRNIKCPIFGSFGQFKLHILPLVEKADGSPGQKWLGIFKKQGQGSQRPGNDALNLR